MIVPLHSGNQCIYINDELPPPGGCEAVLSPFPLGQLMNYLRVVSMSYLSLYSQDVAAYSACNSCSLYVE